MAALEVHAIENMEDLYIVQVKNTLNRSVTLPRGSVIRFRAFHWDGTVTVDELEIEDDIVIGPRDIHRFEVEGEGTWAGDKAEMIYETKEFGKQVTVYRV